MRRPEWRPRRSEPSPNPERGDRGCKPAAIVDLHGDAADRRLPERWGEPPPRHLPQKAVERLFLFHPKHGIKVTAHARIRQIGGPSRKDLVVRRRNMSMRADDQTCPSVDKMPHRLLFTGRLGVHV